MAVPATHYVPRPAGPTLVKGEPAEKARPLFQDSLFESSGRIRTRMHWTAFASVLIQVVCIGLLILAPMVFIEALPRQQLLTFLVAPAPPPPPPPPAAAETIAREMRRVESEILASGGLRMPTKIPEKVQMIKEETAPPPAPAVGGVIGGVPGGIPGGQLGGVIGSIIGSTGPVALPKAPAVVPPRVRVSQGVSRGMLIQQVKPEYSQLARAARVQGAVVLHAIIGRDGAIQNLQVVSGHPVLIQSAIDAVKQWRYRPYLLNGEPVEVDTEITVKFSLSG